MYATFTAIQFHVQTEQATSRGRIDIVVELSEDIAVLELKIDEAADVAVAQALARDYASAYQLAGKKLTVYGLSFNKKLHLITDSVFFAYGTYDIEAHRWQNEPAAKWAFRSSKPVLRDPCCLFVLSRPGSRPRSCGKKIFGAGRNWIWGWI